MKTTLFVLFAAGWRIASAQSMPAISPPVVVRPSDRKMVIEGSTAAGDTYSVVRVKAFTPEGLLSQSMDGLVQAGRDFLIAVRTALTAGQTVEVCAVGEGGELACSNPVSVTGAAVAPAAAPAVAASTPLPAPIPTVTPASTDACAAGADSDKSGPITFDPFTSGATRISGSAPVATGQASLCVNGIIQKLDNDTTASTGTPVSGAKWTIDLKTALKSGDAVRVIVRPPNSPVRISVDKTVPPACTGQMQFTTSPKEGQTHIYGIASPSSDSLKCAVSVYINGDTATIVDNQGQGASSVATDATGQFSAGLKTGLDPGQCVALVQFTAGQRASAGDIESARQCNTNQPSPAVPVQLVSSYLDLGRARTYVMTGVVMSANGGNFDSQNLFLGFSYDKNWIWGGPPPPGPAGGRLRMKRIMLNTYFTAQLTAVPVTTIDCTVAANAALAACKSPAAPATTTPVAATTPIDTFIASRKAAELDAGAYLPVIATTWIHDRDPYAFTIGPIAKVGFITPTDTVDANGNTVAALSSQTFYTSYGFGARLGLSKLSYSHDVAPGLISYFDVVSGRFSQFDNNVLPYGADPLTYRFHRPWRFGFEGAFKIPTLPFVIGISANVHQNFGLGNSDTVSNAKDDLRFFIGTKFDFGTLLGKLKPLN